MYTRVADEVWIATARLHYHGPDESEFEVVEIVRSAERTVEGEVRPGVLTHAYIHCVANAPPSPSGRYRMLIRTPTGRRRLFRPGDPCHPGRESGETVPACERIPDGDRYLIDWYRDEYASPKHEHPDPILSLRGLGKELWADVDADEYVRQLREG